MERGMTADQVVGALWRRKALLAAIAAAVFVIGAAIVLLTPSVYEATVVVRVEGQRPAAELVQNTVSDRIEQRLLTVRQELLARPVLQKAIQEMNLYPEIVSKKGMEVAVEQMRKDLKVKVEGENAFELTYSSRDADTAARVANRLPQVFAEETLKLRQGQAARATELFTGEVEILKKAVSEWEKRIAQFKVDHLGELPEQMEANMRAMERIGGLLQTKSEELRMAETRRSELARGHNAADTEAGRLQSAENGLTRQLVEAQTAWTADHPEVKRLSRELSQMKSARQEAEGRKVAERQERARAATMVAQISKEMSDLQAQAETFQARLDKTPQWAHELGVMNRDYEITKTKYQSVISRKVEAEIAQELEAKSSNSMFNVISPAGVPSQAARPDRFGGLLISLLAALAIAALAGVVLEMRDDSIRDVHEVKDRLPIPVLAVVPQMNHVANAERRFLTPSKATQPPPATIN